MNKNTKKIHAYFLKIHGTVQGVGFRYFCVREARQGNIKGWVRNDKDTTVEVVCEGEKNAIDTFIKKCKKGCAFSHVARMDIRPQDPKGYSNFEIRF